MHGAGLLGHFAQKVPCLFDGIVAGTRSDGHGATSAHELVRTDVADRIERSSLPVKVKSVACVERRLRFDQIAREQAARTLVPDHDVAGGVAAAAEFQQQRSTRAAEFDPMLLRKYLRRAGEARNAVRLLEQPRHAAEFA